MRRLVMMFVLVATAGVAVGCGAGSESSSVSPSTTKSSALERTPLPTFTPATKEVANVRWNLIEGEPETLDSARAFGYSTVELMSNMCEPLEYVLPDGSRAPALATSIDEVNPTTYVVNLRRGVKFWDGNEMTAEDVAFSMNRIRDPQIASYYGAQALDVQSISATGPYVVTIKMKTPEVIYREMLATPLGVVTEKKYVEEKGTTYGTPQGGVMCTGPYELKAWNSGSDIELARNEDWWNADNRKQWPKSATFLWVSDASTSTTALDSGEIDGEFEVPPASISTLRGSREGQLLMAPSTNALVLTPTKNTGTIANVKIRQAIAKLIDYEGFAKAEYADTAVPARAVAGPDTWVSAESVYRSAYEDLPAAEQDLEAARKLVEQSGISDPSLKLAIFAGYPQETPLASQIQASAESIGLKITFDNLPLGEFFQLYSSESARGKYDLMMQAAGSEIPEALQVYQSAFIKNGYNNLSGWNDPTVTKLLSEAKTETDPAKRAELTVAAQKIFTEQMAWIPIVSTQLTAFVNKRLVGLQASVPSVYFWPWLPDLGAK